jgi:hypothetical protein
VDNTSSHLHYAYMHEPHLNQKASGCLRAIVYLAYDNAFEFVSQSVYDISCHVLFVMHMLCACVRPEVSHLQDLQSCCGPCSCMQPHAFCNCAVIGTLHFHVTHTHAFQDSACDHSSVTATAQLVRISKLTVTPHLLIHYGGGAAPGRLQL